MGNYALLIFIPHYLVAELNSTPIWNLILQIPLPSIVEFNLSELSVKIFMEIWLSHPAGRMSL